MPFKRGSYEPLATFSTSEIDRDNADDDSLLDLGVSRVTSQRSRFPQIFCRRCAVAFFCALLVFFLALITAWALYPLQACTGNITGFGTDDEMSSPRVLTFSANVTRLNHVSSMGSHNSYHNERSWLRMVRPWQYAHRSLDDQLAVLQLASVEFDLHISHDRRHWNIYHMPVVDSASSVTCFADALRTLRSWSDAHPQHMPLYVSIEPKYFFDRLRWCRSPASGFAEFVALQQLVLQHIPRSRIVAPVDVVHDAGAPSLRDAVTTRGWPDLISTMGSFIFDLDLWTENAKCRAGFNRIPFADQLFFERGTFVASAANVSAAVPPNIAMVAVLSPGDHVPLLTRMVRDNLFVRATVALGDSSDAHTRAMIARFRDAGVQALATDNPYAAGLAVWTCNQQVAPPDCPAALAAALALAAR